MQASIASRIEKLSGAADAPQPQVQPPPQDLAQQLRHLLNKLAKQERANRDVEYVEQEVQRMEQELDLGKANLKELRERAAQLKKE